MLFLGQDSRREIQKVMSFLGKELSEDVVQKILLHTSFKAMKNNPMVNFSGLPETVFDQSVSCFMRKGEWLQVAIDTMVNGPVWPKNPQNSKPPTPMMA